MTNKEIISRLESISIDVQYKAENSPNLECSEEWRKDLTALELAVTILQGLNKWESKYLG